MNTYDGRMGVMFRQVSEATTGGGEDLQGRLGLQSLFGGQFR